MSTRIQVECLFAQSTSSGKFYLGIVNDRAPWTVWGAGHSGAAGQTKKHSSAGAVEKVLSGKKKKGAYSHRPLRDAPDGMKNTIIGLIRAAIPTLQDASYTFTSTGLEFAGADAPSQTPRRSPSVNHVWI
jgi:hypothetical protein